MLEKLRIDAFLSQFICYGPVPMDQRQQFPVTGIIIAGVTCFFAVFVGLDLALAAAIFVLWSGSLYLATAQPPAQEAAAQVQPLTRDTMRDLIENSATPLLLTESGKVAIANRAARETLGQHIVGQDARVAFRQPEAIKLISRDRNGAAFIRGLVRRRDIWRMSLQRIDSQLAVIELINHTAEADISRAHTDFVANASHELRTPLASIIGYVETLSESGSELGEERAQKFYDTILREARRLQSLVSDLMSLSRIEAEKHDQPSEKVDLTALVERAARDASPGDRIARLELDLASGVTVMGDVQQIEQMVRNLVDNAFKYGGADTPVAVSLTRGKEGQARIMVQDHGEGIAPEHIPHLTRRFYRTDPSRSRASGGTGLGLAIVKHIVERHRGRFDIASKLGEGTSFTIRIPLAETEVSQAS